MGRLRDSARRRECDPGQVTFSPLNLVAETLYAILKNGTISPITDVTALAIDNTLTIKPGDDYRDEWVEQTVVAGTNNDVVITQVLGDQVTPTAPHEESWLCSFWKFTRGASLPIIRLKWTDVEAICDQYPGRQYTGTNTGVVYLTLRSGKVAVITGVAASTTAIAPNTSLTVYPGDYYRNTFMDMGTDEGNFTLFALAVQRGDAANGDALRAENWGASHYEFTRTGLLTIQIPWSNVVGGPATSYPNRAV